MPILHVIPSVAPSEGGPSRAIIVIERALSAAGIAMVTATTDHGRKEREPTSETIITGPGRIVRFYARKRINFYKVAPGLVPWLWTNIGSFDAVHIHALFSFSTLAAGVIARLRGVPYIVRPLGTLTAYGMTRRPTLKRASFRLIEAPILRRAAAVHFTSKQEEEEARALNIPMRGVVIPLGVEEQKPGDANRVESEFPALSGKRAILFLSRVDPKKNIEALLDAFAALALARETAMLLIAGSGDTAYIGRVKKRAQDLGIAGQVIWLGHLDGQKKQDVFARADIYVLPSFSENFGIAAVEAMLARLPCIISKGVAVAQPAAAEGAVIAVEPRADAVSAALNQLLADETLRREMGAKARAHAQHHYSTEAMAKALKELYASLLTVKAKREIA